MNGLRRSTSDASQYRRILLRASIITVGAVLAAACDLTEVEIPVGEPVVVVHGIMRPDEAHQYVIVENALIGTVNLPYRGNAQVPTLGGPRTPVLGATVQVTNLDFPEDSCDNPVAFIDRHPGLFYTANGVYFSPTACPPMRAGDKLALTIETLEGDTITGVTRVPGIETAWMVASDDSLPFGTDSVTTFNRDRDTLRVHVEPVAGRLLQLDIHRRGDFNQSVEEDHDQGTKILVDTMSVSLPGDLLDVFRQGEGDDVFRAGSNYVVSVAVTDSNYFDFARSRSNQYTGRGFLNRLSGGIGVFGSLAATSTMLKVVGEFDDPRDGVYRLQGEIQGVNVDVTLTAYAVRTEDSTEFSAFLDGDWLQIQFGAWRPWYVESRSVDGTWIGEAFSIVMYQPIVDVKPSMIRLLLRGTRKPAESFGVGVSHSTALHSDTLGTLTATQERDH